MAGISWIVGIQKLVVGVAESEELGKSEHM